MAIIIPSKNIYEIDNQKSKDNIIDNVTVETTNVNIKYEYEKSLSYETPEKVSSQNKESIDKNGSRYVEDYNIATIVSGCKIYDTYNTYNIKFPKLGFTEIVKKIYGIEEAEKPPYIQSLTSFNLNSNYFYVDKSFKLKEGFTNISGDEIQINKGTFDFGKIIAFNGEKTIINLNENFNDIQSVKVNFSADTILESSENLKVTWKTPSTKYSLLLQSSEEETPMVTSEFLATCNVSGTTYEGDTSSIITSTDYKTEENIKTITYKEDDEFFIFEGVKLITKRTIYATASAFSPNILTSGYFDSSISYGSQVVEINLEAVDVGFKFLGNTISFELVDSSTNYSNSSNKKPFTLNRNELLQSGALFSATPLSEKLANDILANYENGKETAVLLCDINEYHKEVSYYIPNDYYNLGNATYDNGIVKQIKKDYANATDTNVGFEFIVGVGDDIRFTSPTELVGLQLVDTYGSITHDGIAYFRQVTYTLKDEMGNPKTLDKDLIINFRQDVIASDYLANPIILTKGNSAITFYAGNELQEDLFSSSNQISNIVKTIELEEGLFYPQTINKFALYYNDILYGEKTISSPQILEFEFKKLMGSAILKFVAVGENVNTYISYDLRYLNDGDTYKFSTNITNITNGEVSWQDVKIKNLSTDTLAISTKNNTKPMTFEIGDEIIPMIYTANGKDEPMSRKKDNSPKVFRVVGRDMIYDGAVWQKIYLQEK